MDKDGIGSRFEGETDLVLGSQFAGIALGQSFELSGLQDRLGLLNLNFGLKSERNGWTACAYPAGAIATAKFSDTL